MLGAVQTQHGKASPTPKPSQSQYQQQGLKGPKNNGCMEEYGKKETVQICVVILSPNSWLRFHMTGQHAGESLKNGTGSSNIYSL